MNCTVRGREEYEVLYASDAERARDVHPEQNSHCRNEPGSACWDTVGLDAEHDAGYAEPETREEETLAGMGEGVLKQPRSLNEAQCHKGCNEREEDEVKDEDNLADGVEAGEGVRGAVEQRGDAAGGHCCGIPCPCEVSEALFESESLVGGGVFDL